MRASNLFGMVSNVSRILADIEARGFRVQVGDDFTEYRYLRQARGPGSPIYPMFDAASSFVDATNAFWLCGFNDQDELIHTQAIRSFDLTGTTLKNHMDVHRHKYITPNTTPDPDLTFYSRPRALKSITGKVAYHGDFWLRHDGKGDARRQGLTPHLSRIVFELCLVAWAPNFVFGLVPKRYADKGLHVRYGYSHCEPGVWIGPDKQVTDEDCLVWMTTSDIVGFVNSDVRSLDKPQPMSSLKSSVKAV